MESTAVIYSSIFANGGYFVMVKMRHSPLHEDACLTPIPQYDIILYSIGVYYLVPILSYTMLYYTVLYYSIHLTLLYLTLPYQPGGTASEVAMAIVNAL